MTLKVGILASTKGSDIPAIIDAIDSGEVDAEISLILTNKECGALDYAKGHDIPNTLILSKGRDREEFDKEVAEAIDNAECEIILLIGYMRYLSKWFVHKYWGKIINIHPSLLPKYAGGMDTNVHQAVLDAGETVTGCTLHIVDEGADTGPIVYQKEVEIEPGETADTLKLKVQIEEQKLLIKFIDEYSKGNLRIEDGQVIKDDIPSNRK